MAAPAQDSETVPTRHVPAPEFVRALTFVSDVAARSLESHDFQLLPVGLLESVFGDLATAGDRLKAVVRLFRHWQEHGARLPQRYYMHIAEPAGVLALEAHHAYRCAAGPPTALQERRVIDVIARELGLTLVSRPVRGGRLAGATLAVTGSSGGRKLEVATREAVDGFEPCEDVGSYGVRGAMVHLRTRILLAPLAELVMERTPGLVTWP